MNETGETVREVCAEMREHSSGDASETYYDRFAWEVLIDRILAAHEREFAARDAEIAQLVTKCNRLMSALKPVLEVNLEGLANFGIDYKSLLAAIVADSQRIVGAWDDKNYFDKENNNAKQ